MTRILAYTSIILVFSLYAGVFWFGTHNLRIAVVGAMVMIAVHIFGSRWLNYVKVRK